MTDTSRASPASTRSSFSSSSSSSSVAASSWADGDDDDRLSASSVASPRHPRSLAVPSLVVTFVPACAERLLGVANVASALREEFALLSVSSRPPLVALRSDSGSDLDDASMPLRFDVRFGTTGEASRALDAAESATDGVLALSQVSFNTVHAHFAYATPRSRLTATGAADACAVDRTRHERHKHRTPR
jgi:hypothetical protein